MSVDDLEAVPAPSVDLRRRALLGGAGAAGLAALFGSFGGCAGGGGGSPAPTATPGGPGPALPAWLAELEQRTFNYFWETTPHDTGLTPDRWPSPSNCSVAAVGFGLTANVIGSQRGWITRAQAAERTRNTLRFFRDAPQGPQRSGVIGHMGFFYHFLDPKTGHRSPADVELSTVDTALFLLGALHGRQYFDGNDPVEAQIRILAEELYARVNWRWALGPGGGVAMAWSPERGHADASWNGYDEAMFVYLLALGSPTHALGPSAWAEWSRTYESKTRWGERNGQVHLQFGPHFGHQYTQCWVDLRGLQDAYMRSKGIDYFENSRRATLAQREYAIRNPNGYKDYGADVWGLTACDGPGNFSRRIDGRERLFMGYSARGTGTDPWSPDDGTIAPTAAAASLPFAPELVVPALAAMRQRYGEHLYRRYGFVDAFNPTADIEAPFERGQRVPGLGWFDSDYIGIDQGPIVAMFANHRSEAVWSLMRRAEWLQRGLRVAGFRGGWLG